MVHDEETHVAVERCVREFTGAVVVNDARNLVGEGAKAEDVGDGVVIYIVDEIVVLDGAGGVVVVLVGGGIVGRLVEPGHQNVRDGSRDVDARSLRSSASNALSRPFHMALCGGHAWWEILCDRF